VSAGGTPSGFDRANNVLRLSVAGGAGLIALAAAWIASALAATESRPDLATLTAVGAPPRTRKKIVAAQAGTIAAIGAGVGTASGLALGAALVEFQRAQSAQWDGNPDPAWGFDIPWLWIAAFAVALPLVAVASAWLATRGRETLTGRKAN